MKLACLVKFAADTEDFTYDYEKNVLKRESSRIILNPDDAAALAVALKLKEKNPAICIDVVSMAPESILNLARDILRVKADKFILLSDKLFAGSDTYATSRIIATYLAKQNYRLILSGSHTLDGDTGHVPSQIAEILNVGQLSNIISINELNFDKEFAVVTAEHETSVCKYRLKIPAVLSFIRESGYKMPFVRYDDLELYVDDRIEILGASKLGLTENETGLKGSLTAVRKTYSIFDNGKESVFVKTDDEGIEAVYKFLKEKGFLNE